MKKIYTLLAATVVAGTSFAQTGFEGKSFIKETKNIHRSETSLKVAEDTTGWASSGNFFPDFAAGGSVSDYGYNGGGYVYGSNVDSLNVCAQGYENSNELNFDIEEVLALFTGKTVMGQGANITFEIYSMAANAAYTHDGTNWVPNSAEGPSSLLGSASLHVGAADTTWPALTSIPFSSPVSIMGTNFAIAMDASAFEASGDTIGLASDTDGEGNRYAFHKAGSVWAVTDDMFGGLNNNIALFAVVSNSNVGIESNDFLGGIQMSAFPNPAKENTTIAFNLNKSFNKVTIKVMDATGKNIATIEKGAMAQGEYTELVDLSNVAAGKYYYSVITNESRLTKKIMVIK